MNKTDSYKHAYPVSVDWKPNSITDAAFKLELKPHIQARLKELRQPAIDILEARSEDIVGTLIKAGLGELTKEELKKINFASLLKATDKLLATKSESKTEHQVPQSLMDFIKARKSKSE